MSTTDRPEDHPALPLLPREGPPEPSQGTVRSGGPVDVIAKVTTAYRDFPRLDPDDPCRRLAAMARAPAHGGVEGDGLAQGLAQRGAPAPLESESRRRRLFDALRGQRPDLPDRQSRS